MDCLTFITSRMKSKRNKRVKIPYYAALMISKQMNATWPFHDAKSKLGAKVEKSGGRRHFVDTVLNKRSTTGMPTIKEEELIEKRRKSRNVERRRRRRKGVRVGSGGRPARIAIE